MILLGAGASVEAGVPATFAMTERLVAAIGEGSLNSHASALHFVCGALLAYDAAEGKSPFGGLDVERVFAAVELLAKRRTLEVTPFVSAWHPAVDALDRPPRPAKLASFDRELQRALREPPEYSRARKLLIQLIHAEAGKSSAGESYTELARQMLAALRELVATTPKVVDYLDPLAREGVRHGGLTIATLNYDRAIEQAAAKAGVPLTTGLDTWAKDGHWSWPTDGIRLLKLHGSIDWVWEEVAGGDGHLPRRVVAVSAEPDRWTEPALVFGQREKLRAEGPFLGLLAEFETQLTQAERLVVIGYSFRDDHVNELIRRWAGEDIARTILVVDPHWPKAHTVWGDFRGEMMRSLLPPQRRGQPPPFSPRLEVWEMSCSKALAQLAG